MRYIPITLVLLLSATLLQAQSPGESAITDLRAYLAKPRDQRPDLSAQPFAKTPLTKSQAADAKKLLVEDHAAFIRQTRKDEWDNKAIVAAGKTLKLLEKHFGQKPKDGWDLFISMHGGGNATQQLNDSQWENQIRLYSPDHSLVIAPRAPTNTWNLWHESHIDTLFDRLIEDAIVLGEVNPNRVYIMGYSAGGDGVYQLAPRMADRWAAASMMAGHPNDASPLGLRNLPFAIHVGALDGGYNRNKIAAEWKIKLDDLQKADPQGYIHEVQLHQGRSHWMNLEDRAALPWMQKYTRNPIPDKVVWKQASTTHDHFYWLAIDKSAAKPGQLAIASRKGQSITIEKTEQLPTLTILFNDDMLNLDQPITITSSDGKALSQGKLSRTIQTLHDTLEANRGDPNLTFSASTTIKP